MYIKINQRYLNTNQTQKVKPTDINVKRTYINMKQADAQINARWRFWEAIYVIDYWIPGWFAPVLFRPEMFRTCLGAKHLTVFRYFSRIIIPLKLIITYTRIEICF